MALYVISKVRDKMWQMQMETLAKLLPPSLKIEISNVALRPSSFVYDVHMTVDGRTAVIRGCEYSKELFSECIEPPKNGATPGFNPIPYDIRYEKLIKKLRLAEMNEEGKILDNVKDYITRCNSFRAWMHAVDTGESGNAETVLKGSPYYYAGKLSECLDEAERYLEALYIPLCYD
jgi:hypothetical protein